MGQVAKPTKDVLDAIALLAKTCVIPQVHQEALIPHFIAILETHQEFLEALPIAEEAKQFINHHSVSPSIILIFCDDCTALGERLNVIYGRVDALRIELKKLEAKQNELEADIKSRLEAVSPFQLECEQMKAQIAEKELEVQKHELLKARMKAEFDQCATLIKSKTYAKKKKKN